MSPQIKHWFFLYFVNGDRHIFLQSSYFPEKRTWLEILRFILRWFLKRERFGHNNWAFIIHHYLRKRFGMDIITEFKFISRMMLIVMIDFTTSD